MWLFTGCTQILVLFLDLSPPHLFFCFPLPYDNMTGHQLQLMTMQSMKPLSSLWGMLPRVNNSAEIIQGDDSLKYSGCYHSMHRLICLLICLFKFLYWFCFTEWEWLCSEYWEMTVLNTHSHMLQEKANETLLWLHSKNDLRPQSWHVFNLWSQWSK